MNVLAIGCHPDDLEINVFGTLARCLRQGDDVVICGVADSSGGSMVFTPEESAAVRLKEATRGRTCWPRLARPRCTWESCVACPSRNPSGAATTPSA